MTYGNVATDFDRLVASWLTADGPSDIRAEIVDDAIDASRHVRPRRGLAAWLAGVRPWPQRRRRGVPLPPRSVLVVALLAALVLALVAVAIGSRPPHQPRPTLRGEVTETGPMSRAVWVPVTEVLADGSVLVIGPVPEMWLHAERWDPASGTFAVVRGMPPTRAVPGSFGSVRLADGDVLVLARRYRNRREDSGGYAVRFDRADGVFRPAGTFTPGAVPGHIAEFGFANWPATVGSEGIVRWRSPIPGDAEPIVTYDPVADRFGLEASVPGDPGAFRPTEDSTATVTLGDGGRSLWLEQGPGSGVTARVVSPTGKIESQYEWPLVRGEHYDGAVLPDGRVLLVGPTTAIVDPATGDFDEIQLDVVFAVRARWLDGRILLEGHDTRFDAVDDTGAWRQDGRAWVFDPTSDEFSMLSETPIRSMSAWTVLEDGRVLIVSEDDGAARGARNPIALVLR